MKEKDNIFHVGASQAFKEEKKLSQHEGADGAKASTESASAKPLSPVAETFRVIQGAMSEEYVRTTQGVFQFELSGKIITCATCPCTRCFQTERLAFSSWSRERPPFVPFCGMLLLRKPLPLVPCAGRLCHSAGPTAQLSVARDRARRKARAAAGKGLPLGPSAHVPGTWCCGASAGGGLCLHAERGARGNLCPSTASVCSVV